jgi:hypothetical protein
MIHLMTDEWEIEGIGPASIQVADLFGLIKYKNIFPIQLTLEDISHKEVKSIDTSSSRFILADTKYPMIVVENMPNPHNKRYRMIDGRHRLLKQTQQGLLYFSFYVLQYDDIKYYIRRV